MATVGVHNIVPDNSNLANRLGQIFDQKRADLKQQETLAKVNELTNVISTGTPEEVAQARREMAILNPQGSNALNAVIEDQQLGKALETQKEAKRIAVNALIVRDLPDLVSKRTYVAKLAQEDLKAGKDITKYEELLKIQDVDELNLALTKVATKATDADKFIESKLKPATAPQTREIKKGDQIVTQEFNQTTGKYENIAEADRFKSDALSPEAVAQKKEIANAGAPQTKVELINEAESEGLTAEQKEAGKLRVQRFNELQNKALAAEEQNASLAQLENIDVEQGFGVEAKGQVARIVNALGGNGEAFTGVDPANVQAFNSVAGKAVLDIMSTQKGPQTDKDQERIAKTLPKITNEKDANEFNLNSLKALNFRRIEMAEFYEKEFEEKGTLKGADKAWRDFKAKTPMLSDNVKNPSTGLPMFFHEFKSKAKESNPAATDEQLIKAWRELTSG